jgi:putative endonuclease
MSCWYVYILECSDGSYYTGIARNPYHRIEVHNAGRGPAWTRKRRPVVLKFCQELPSKSAARRREIEIKGWRREKKQRLFGGELNTVH